jgi:prophage antirepressor-like protein
MNDLTIFNKENFQVRTVIIDDAIWFVAKDVCDCLCIVNSRDALSDLDKEGVANTDTLTNGGLQSLSIINESNLYCLIFKSRKPEALAFKSWITKEVIPSIRKTGSYSVKNLDLIEMARQQIKISEELIRVETERKLLENKVNTIEPTYDNFLSSKTCLTMNQVAKQLVDCGQNVLFKFLRDRGILFDNKDKPNYNLPKQNYIDNGYFKTRTVPIKRSKGVDNKPQTLVTPKGMQFILDTWNNNKALNKKED